MARKGTASTRIRKEVEDEVMAEEGNGGFPVVHM